MPTLAHSLLNEESPNQSQFLGGRLKYQQLIVGVFFSLYALAAIAKGPMSTSMLDVENSTAQKPFNMLSLGDSIGSATNVDWIPVQQPSCNWGTGTRSGSVDSHFCRLCNRKECPVKGEYRAVKGSRAKDVIPQINKSKFKSIDYVTLGIGGNDVCAWKKDYREGLKEFSDQISRIMGKLTCENPGVKITLIPIPNMLRLYELGSKRKWCRFIWKRFKACPPLLGEDVTEEERKEFGERVKSANGVLKKISEQFPDSVKYIQEIEEFKFEAKHVSATDCFHPSLEGQSAIAETSWKHGWFTELPLKPKERQMYAEKSNWETFKDGGLVGLWDLHKRQKALYSPKPEKKAEEPKKPPRNFFKFWQSSKKTHNMGE